MRGNSAFYQITLVLIISATEGAYVTVSVCLFVCQKTLWTNWALTSQASVDACFRTEIRDFFDKFSMVEAIVMMVVVVEVGSA